MRFDEMLMHAMQQLQKVQESMYLTYSLENKCQFEDACEEAFRLEDAAEKLMAMIRGLPACAGHPKAKERVNAIIAKNVPISAEYTPEGWFKLCIPALLPRKERGSADYILGYLYPAIERFVLSNDRRDFNKSVIIFRHVYDYQRPERLFRDHDNIEINAVVDVLAHYLLRGDSPMRLAHFYDSACGEADCTEVYIVERYDYQRFLTALDNGEIGAPEVQLPQP